MVRAAFIAATWRSGDPTRGRRARQRAAPGDRPRWRARFEGERGCEDPRSSPFGAVGRGYVPPGPPGKVRTMRDDLPNEAPPIEPVPEDPPVEPVPPEEPDERPLPRPAPGNEPLPG